VPTGARRAEYKAVAADLQPGGTKFRGTCFVEFTVVDANWPVPLHACADHPDIAGEADDFRSFLAQWVHGERTPTPVDKQPGRAGGVLGGANPPGGGGGGGATERGEVTSSSDRDTE